MLRRDFLRRAVAGIGASLFAARVAPAASLETEPLPRKFNAHDEVVLGKTGIRTSRLAMGTGTIGYGGASNQTRLGNNPFVTMRSTATTTTASASSIPPTRTAVTLTLPKPSSSSRATR